MAHGVMKCVSENLILDAIQFKGSIGVVICFSVNDLGTSDSIKKTEFAELKSYFR